MKSRIGKYSYKGHTTASQAVTHVASESGALSRTEERGAPLTIDDERLREVVPEEPGTREVTTDEADQDARELNVLARILIDAVREERRHDKTN